MTGATDGIGKEYVKWLTQRNYRVVAIGRNSDKLAETVKIHPELVTPYQLDFTTIKMDPESVTQHWELMKEAVSTTGGELKLGGVVNCVGMAHFCPYFDLSLEKVDQIHRTNIDSLHLMLQILLLQAKLDRTPNPFFVNISSVASQYPSPRSSVYGATKAYLSNMIAAVSQEESNTTFLDVKPHYVTTKMVGNMKDWDTASPS